MFYWRGEATSICAVLYQFSSWVSRPSGHPPSLRAMETQEIAAAARHFSAMARIVGPVSLRLRTITSSTPPNYLANRRASPPSPASPLPGPQGREDAPPRLPPPPVRLPPRFDILLDKFELS